MKLAEICRNAYRRLAKSSRVLSASTLLYGCSLFGNSLAEGEFKYVHLDNQNNQYWATNLAENHVALLIGAYLGRLDVYRTREGFFIRGRFLPDAKRDFAEILSLLKDFDKDGDRVISKREADLEMEELSKKIMAIEPQFWPLRVKPEQIK